MIRAWWQEKTAYQIYPKSFYDSNDDGIGDIPGIIEKLDYLKELGIEILWISPVYLSPCADQGYDIADYYQIDPQFGTMEDMDRLLKEAKKRGIYVLMDLVVNHCSDEHEWFKKACEDPDGPYGKYFYITKEGEMPPSNWRSYFGGSVWEPLPGTDRYYLHLFHKKQPDLNWENPKLREAIYRMVNWWLEKGLAGFRIDAIINIKKPLPFQDYAADREDGLCDMGIVLAEANGIGDFLGELRDRVFAPHDAFTVGEVFHVSENEMPAFIGENGYFSSMFDFAETLEGASPLGWYANRIPTPEDYKRCCFASQEQVSDWGYLSTIIENHDEPRGVSHYLPQDAQHETGKKLLATMYFMLRGLPFIYQGQELGMCNRTWETMDEMDDVGSHAEYTRCLEAGLSHPEAMQVVSQYSRDNARTPFQWTDGANAGFSKADPWLALNPNYKEINAAEQRVRKDSVFHYYQNLIALRKSPEYKETIVYGKLVPVWTEERNLMAYLRVGEEKTLLVVGNFDKTERSISLETLPSEYHTVIPDASGETKTIKLVLDNCGDERVNIQSGILTIKPYQAMILALPD